MPLETETPSTRRGGETEEQRHMPLDPRLLESLVCPVTHGPLIYDREREELISRKAALVFPVRDGVPIMLRNEARPLEE